MTHDYLRAAQDMTEPLAGFLAAIVGIRSLSREEGAVIGRIREEMERLGYDEARVDPMGNLIGRIGHGPVAVAIDGHCDTVDSGDPAQWEGDPFAPARGGGFLRGRGVVDQKGGLAAAVYAGGLLKQCGIPNNVSLYVVASVQEEDCDGQCWQYIVEQDGIRPGVVVLTEPTSLRIYRGHRGRMEIEVATKGISAHGSAPERGVNAIYRMAPIVSAIEELNSKLPSLAPFGKGSVTISQIRSRSPSLCAVADGCVIHLDRRLTSGETDATAVAEIAALPAVRAAGGEVSVLEYREPSYTGLVYPVRKYYPTWELPEAAPEVQCARRACQAAFGTPPEVGFWTFSTNGVATAGKFGIPTIGFGPGEERQAHAPNERIAIDQLPSATAFYAAFVEAYADSPR